MKKVIFIIVSVLAMLGLLFWYGFRVNEAKYKEFSDDGYILARVEKNGTESSTKYYFSSGTKYRENYEEQYLFQNTDQEEVEVVKTSFVHYLDNGISTLSKTAILDLDNLNTEVIRYYSFYEGSKLAYQDNGHYQIRNLDKVLSFTNFLMKISENKYMIVAPKINLVIDGETRVIENSYLEFEFLDGNIIRLENQEASFQSIASDMYIELDNGVKINLADKNIFLGSEKKLNLTQVTIDSDDNIEITPDEEEEKEELEPTPTETSNPLEGLTDGSLNGNQDDNEEEVNEDEKVNDPLFSVVDMTVSSNKLDATIEYEDQDGLLTGDLLVKIIQTSSNKVVYQTRENSGLSNFHIEVENLMPNTNYILVVNSDYTKNGKQYNRDFIQKTFVTESLGIELVKNYFTTEVLSFYLEVDDSSRVKSAEVMLMDANGEAIETQEVSLENLENNRQEITFDELTSNTEYQVRVYNFLYDNSIISDNFTIENSYKTLKQKPFLGKTSFTVNKKDSLFSLKVNNISDADNGIVSYRYEIYDARSLMDNPTSVEVIEKNNKSSVDLQVDNVTILRGVPYVFKMIATFYDNEKEYEYETEFSNIMQMDGVEFPSIRFESKEVTFERIVGNIIITDNGNTISLDNNSVMTITYTDSVGNSNSYTTSGSYNIPFSVNNLRANESYTISVYATVNLQDGNEVIDNCYIGSVVIQTEPTKPFLLDYSVDSSDIDRAFSITSRLGAEDGVDNTLEANTLEGLMFNLYAGTSTNGNLVKSVRKVDHNLNDYESELKEAYYDQSFLLDPSFFGLKNQDMTSEYYTIEVTNAYDYTTYQNNIPIKNNVITVKTNGYIPDLPTDVNNAIEVNVIRNNSDPDRYREELDPETIIGYRIRAGYDNSKKYAKRIEYQVIDSVTGKVIDTLSYDIPSDGSIGYVEFYLEDGTPYDEQDDSFRRGNRYYFTYKAYLDLNFDGTTETVYPKAETGVVLRSTEIAPEKQSAYFYTYPSTYKNSKLVWSYRYSDIDHALVDNVMHYKMDSSELGNLPITPSDTFSKLEFPLTRAGNLTLYVQEAKIKADEQITDRTLVYQKFELPYKASTRTYNVTLETNRLIITLLDYAENTAFYDRVAGARLVFTGNKTVTLDNLVIDSGVIVVDLADLEELINQEVTTELYLYYDNGVLGYDTVYDSNDSSQTDKFALQMIENSVYDGSYYSLDSRLNLRTNVQANGSLFHFQLTQGKQNTLTLTDLNKQQDVKVDLISDEGGYSYNYEYLFPKQLGQVKATSDGSEKFEFNMIIPGISIMDKNGNTNIAAALVYADVNIKLYGDSGSQILDNKIYIEVYQTDESGLESNLIDTLEVSTSDLDHSIRIENLIPKTNYFIRVFADVDNGGTYERTQLYDVDYQNNNRNYYFRTLGSVGASNIQIEYTADSYDEKYLKVSYQLQEITGFDRLIYEVYKVGQNEAGEEELTKVDLAIDPDYVFSREMTKYIKVSPGSGVTTEQRYAVVIRAFTMIDNNDESYEIELQPASSYHYTFNQLRQPYIGISSARDNSDGLSLTFRVSVYDYQKVIYNDNYRVQILDQEGNDITPDEYKGKEYHTDQYNQKFTINQVEPDKQYTLKILYTMNVVNAADTLVEEEKTYVSSSLNDAGVDVGKIYAVTNLDDQTKVNLVFYDSYRLTSINNIRYSIYSNNEYAIDNQAAFVPVLSTASGVTYYTYTLPDSITEPGVYYIQLQFLTDDRVIAEESIQYNFVD